MAITTEEETAQGEDAGKTGIELREAQGVERKGMSRETCIGVDSP